MNFVFAYFGVVRTSRSSTLSQRWHSGHYFVMFSRESRDVLLVGVASEAEGCEGVGSCGNGIVWQKVYRRIIQLVLDQSVRYELFVTVARRVEFARSAPEWPSTRASVLSSLCHLSARPSSRSLFNFPFPCLHT